MDKKIKQLVTISEMHSFQVIALVGLIMSVAAHAIMLLMEKQVPSFGYIYPSWSAIFLVGYLLNISGKDSGADHHH